MKTRLYTCLLLIATTWLLETSQGVVTQGSIAFDRVKEISISHSYWRVTYVIDLSVYDDLFEKSFKYVGTTAAAVWKIITLNNLNKDLVNFNPQYKLLHDQMVHMNDTKDRLMATLDEYKSLRMRSQRAIVPVIGTALNWLFGVADEDSMDDIRQAINDMNTNQQKIKHVVNQSLTLISDTHEKVMENRGKINTIVLGLGDLQKGLTSFVNKTNTLQYEIIHFLTYYNQLKSIADDMQEMIVEAIGYINDLRAQIDMLSMGRLTPSVIGPMHLRRMLTEVAKKLPPNMYLPLDTKLHMWEFYRRITCSAAFDKRNVLIVLQIPLSSFQDQFDLVKAYNMPIPNTNMFKKDSEESFNPKQMVAQYKTEANAFIMDRTQSRYVLLTSREAEQCLRSSQSFCSFKGPMYRVGPEPKFCVIAAFLGNKQKIKKVCKIRVRPNSVLPYATNVDNGSWLVSTMHALTLTVDCKARNLRQQKRVTTISVQPPLKAITLPPNCAATSEYLILPAYYDLKSTIRIRPTILDIFKDKNYTVWEPLYEKHPNFDATWNLSTLAEIDEISMGGLINELQSLKMVQVNKKETALSWVQITLIIAGFILALILFSVSVKYARTISFSSIVGTFHNRSGDSQTRSQKNEQLPLSRVYTPTAPIDNQIYDSQEETTKFTLHPLELNDNVHDTPQVNPNFKLYPPIGKST